MKPLCHGILLMLLAALSALPAGAADTVCVRETQVPVLIERRDNVLFYLRLDAAESRTLSEIILDLSTTAPGSIAAVKLYYGGTEAPQDKQKRRFAPVKYLSNNRPGRTLEANPSYSVLCAKASHRPGEPVRLACDYPLFPGVNFFWVSLEMNPAKTTLHTQVRARVLSARLDKHEAPLQLASDTGIVHRMGIGVRHAGDDGVAAYRIPGLVTTSSGTLLAVYDVRRNSSVDLQEDIDIGLKYTALASGDIDVTNAYTTDAQLANPDIDVVTLDDDLGLQVDYYCSTVVRSDTLERCPGLEEALMRMDGLISEADMARMNYLVEVEGQDERQVALDYLTAKGVL